MLKIIKADGTAEQKQIAEMRARAAQTGAYALDLSSGIETDDNKDIDKMRRVAALVKGAHQ